MCGERPLAHPGVNAAGDPEDEEEDEEKEKKGEEDEEEEENDGEEDEVPWQVVKPQGETLGNGHEPRVSAIKESGTKSKSNHYFRKAKSKNVVWPRFSLRLLRVDNGRRFCLSLRPRLEFLGPLFAAEQRRERENRKEKQGQSLSFTYWDCPCFSQFSLGEPGRPFSLVTFFYGRAKRKSPAPGAAPRQLATQSPNFVNW
jgi:hypothetical protein